MVKKNACVFISGKGSNLKALIKSTRDCNFPVNIKLVICNNSDAYGLLYAKINSVPFVVINAQNNDFENIALQQIKKHKISIILLAGFMRIISKKFIKNFGKKIINIHPSLLPKFKGLNTFERIIQKKEKKTGCTVHFVDEKLDNGKIILKKSFYINNKDSIETLKKKTQALEYRAFSEAIVNIFRYN